jgi:hypothetical protein
VAQSAATCSRWLIGEVFFYPEYGGDTFLRNVSLQNLYGPTSQKTAFFIVTFVKTSNLTKHRSFIRVGKEIISEMKLHEETEAGTALLSPVQLHNLSSISILSMYL